MCGGHSAAVLGGTAGVGVAGVEETAGTGHDNEDEVHQ